MFSYLSLVPDFIVFVTHLTDPWNISIYVRMYNYMYVRMYIYMYVCGYIL